MCVPFVATFCSRLCITYDDRTDNCGNTTFVRCVQGVRWWGGGGGDIWGLGGAGGGGGNPVQGYRILI